MRQCKICGNVCTLIAENVRDCKGIQVYRCKKCGLGQLSELADVESAQQYYDSNSQAKWVEEINIDVIKHKLRDDTLRRADYVAKYAAKDNEIADIGTGYGFWVKEMLNRGFNTDGYEISKERRAIAEQVTGTVIGSNNLLSTREPLKKKYDIITLFQVLEHICNPQLFLNELYSSLNVNGRILIEVPNFDDWLVEESADYSSFYYQRAHLYYYNSTSLEKLFKSLDFNSFTFEYVQRYSVSNSFNWILNGKPQITSPNHYESGYKNDIDLIYKNKLISDGRADTLIAQVVKNG